jgi:GT2 family glycosyltransferase
LKRTVEKDKNITSLIVSIVIPSHNRIEKLLRLLDSVDESSVPQDAREVIVIDDNCTDATALILAERAPSVTVISAPIVKEGEFNGVSVSRQLGANVARAPNICFIDDDNIIDARMIELLVEALEADPSIGVVGPLMLSWPDGTGIWCAGARFTRTGLPDHQADFPFSIDTDGNNLMIPCDYLPNAFCTRKSTLDTVPFDPKLFPHNFSECDWGFRLQDAGFEVRVVVNAKTWHDTGYKGRTTRISNPAFVRDQARSRIIFRRKYSNRFVSMFWFWIYWFPISSLYYLFRFAGTRQFRKLTYAYLLGTWQGLRSTG